MAHFHKKMHAVYISSVGLFLHVILMEMFNISNRNEIFFLRLKIKGTVHQIVRISKTNLKHQPLFMTAPSPFLTVSLVRQMIETEIEGDYKM